MHKQLKCFFPFCTQIVKEYERAIIFRLGRLLRGGAKGPGQNIIRTQLCYNYFHPHPQLIHLTVLQTWFQKISCCIWQRELGGGGEG